MTRRGAMTVTTTPTWSPARTLAIATTLATLAGLAGVTQAQPATEVGAIAAPPRHAAWVSVPSLDGFRGIEVGVERGVAPRTGVAVAGSVRQAAAGDYDAVRLGVAAAYRRYWRGSARWSQIDGLDRVGWFWGGRIDLSTSRLALGDRHVGTTLVAGARAELGYRLTPWRRLAVTGTLGLGVGVERDADGRLPAQPHRLLGVGLDLGWMF